MASTEIYLKSMLAGVGAAVLSVVLLIAVSYGVVSLGLWGGGMGGVAFSVRTIVFAFLIVSLGFAAVFYWRFRRRSQQRS